MNLLDICYLIFISPLELMMKYILELSFSKFASYGLSLITLSLVVNTLILPIYNKADSWQEEERSIKRRMLARENMIKASFKGQERFALISTLYRQNGYNQFYILRSSIGFFLQIPFFIAAYHLLAFVIDFKGQGFLFIRDLSAPDALLTFGDFRINLLPILMTVVNIGSALIYSKGLARKDKVQLYGMAAVFLVLLYNSPSALTFYWTLNNIYSFFKNIVEKSLLPNLRNSESFRNNCTNKIDRFVYISCLFFSYIQSIRITSFLVKHSYSKIKFIFSLIAVTIIYLLGKQHIFSDDGRVWILLSECLLCFIVFVVLLRTIDLSLKLNSFSFEKIILIYTLILLSFYMLVRVLFSYTVPNKQILDIKYYCFLLLFTISVFNIPQKIQKWYHSIRVSSMLAFVSVATVLSIGLLYHPVKIYCTDPQSFSIAPKEMLFVQFSIYELSILLVALFFAILSRRLLKLVGLFCIFLALLSIVYGFIDFHDYGAIDGFILANEDNLHRRVDFYIDAGVFFLAWLSVYYVLKKRLQRVFYIVFLLTVLSSIGVSIYTAKETISTVQRKNMIRNVDHALYDLLSFSKTGKNIVVVMLDMFTGGNIKEIKEYYPEIIDKLDGFVWYKDTVTAGDYTVYGKPGIIGGEKLHPLNINETASKSSLEERVNKEWGLFFRSLEDNNFSISFVDEDWTDYDLIRNELKSDENIISSLSVFYPLKADYIRDNNIVTYNYKVSPNATMSNIGFFKVLPLSQKRKIYQDGRWGNTINHDKSDMYAEHEYLYRGVLEKLAIYSNTNSKSNTFKYFINQLTHVPWTLDDDCYTLNKNSLTKEEMSRLFGIGVREKEGYSKQHLRSEKCALQSLEKWFDWMKENNVYDNTQIILVSDHGRWDSSELIQAFGGDNGDTTSVVYPIALHGLLLVKDFNAKGELKTNSDYLMANWDVQKLILRNIVQYTNEPWKNKDRVRCSVDGAWPRTSHKKNKYVLRNSVCVKGTIFDRNNWNISKY